MKLTLIVTLENVHTNPVETSEWVKEALSRLFDHPSIKKEHRTKVTSVEIDEQ